MRCWHTKLIPKLCRQHLLACWRESLGMYKIITENKTQLSYWKHPQTKEYVNAPVLLWQKLLLIRREMLNRGYHPKQMPKLIKTRSKQVMHRWQTLSQQIELLKSKKCNCKI
jgi:hypothetical protein